MRAALVMMLARFRAPTATVLPLSPGATPKFDEPPAVWKPSTLEHNSDAGGLQALPPRSFVYGQVRSAKLKACSAGIVRRVPSAADASPTNGLGNPRMHKIRHASVPTRHHIRQCQPSRRNSLASRHLSTLPWGAARGDRAARRP